MKRSRPNTSCFDGFVHSIFDFFGKNKSQQLQRNDTELLSNNSNNLDSKNRTIRQVNQQSKNVIQNTNLSNNNNITWNIIYKKESVINIVWSYI